jgi:hypothetical protein
LLNMKTPLFEKIPVQFVRGFLARRGFRNCDSRHAVITEQPIDII